MPDAEHAMNAAGPDRELAVALRALPDVPPPDLWPGLARALQRRRQPRRWRYALPAALAAGLVLALAVPHGSAPPPATAPAAVAATIAKPAARSELADLEDRSHTLERWIAAVAAHAPQDGRDLMAAVEVEDLIALVDVQLGSATTRKQSLALWRQRVALLEDLATIRAGAVTLAANDIGIAGTDLPPSRLN
jgi:hypothetical protein